MSGEWLTRYTTSRDFKIQAIQPTPFVEPSSTEMGIFISQKGVEKNRVAHLKYNEKLRTIHIDDEESQRSLYAQAISAINGYPINRRELYIDFRPFAFFTEPNGTRFLVGDIEGTWNHEDDSFTLKSIIIHQVCDTPDEMKELINLIQHYNPGVPKVASDSFKAAFAANDET